MTSFINDSKVVTIEVEDFMEFTPKIHDNIILSLFITCGTVIILVALLVHRSVYCTLKRFENRPINTIIMPIMFVNNISVFPYFLILLIKAVYYPLKDLTGTSFCYFHNYYDVWNAIITQSQSFFVSLYRFICLFYTGVLYKKRITPKVNGFSKLFRKLRYYVISSQEMIIVLEYSRTPDLRNQNNKTSLIRGPLSNYELFTLSSQNNGKLLNSGKVFR